MQNPVKLATIDAGELSQLVDSYPYFELGHILLARKFKQENNSQYQRQLEKSAAFTADRIWLNDWFNKQMQKSDKQIDTIESETLIIPIKKEAEDIVTEKTGLSGNHDFLGWLRTLSGDVDESEPLIDPALSNEAILLGQVEMDKELDTTREYKINLTPEEEAGVEVMVTKSSELLNSMVSETLAEIFINQGNRSRAIEIYQQLSLNYPEKSDYFASRIQKLKETE